jgi:hypothetical protein
MAKGPPSCPALQDLFTREGKDQTGEEELDQHFNRAAAPLDVREADKEGEGMEVGGAARENWGPPSGSAAM